MIMSFFFRSALTAIVSILVAHAPAQAQATNGPGVTDKEILIGQTMPYSGPASAFATVGLAQAAYFKMINDQGGINGRTVRLLSYDDAYSPPKTVEQTRRLVESDEVLLIFQSMGTAHGAAVQKYLNTKKVPQLFIATGATRFNDPKGSPWTLAFNPNFKTEGRIYGKYILQNQPDAKIGILFQNDDLGKDYVAGLKEELGPKAASMVVAELSYEVSDPTVDNQLARLRALGANVLFDMSSPKFAAQAIKKLAEMDWKPLHIVDINVTSIGAVLKPAGLDNSKGLVSVSYVKDPADAAWKEDAAVKSWATFMDKYYPAGDKNNFFNAYAYATAELLVEVLTKCGNDLSRDNVLRQATSLRDVKLGMLLPGISISTSAADYRVNRQLQLIRFDGERWQNIGPLITDSASE
jgi:branched-chain amino acid transport system substrate-binding protein